MLHIKFGKSKNRNLKAFTSWKQLSFKFRKTQQAQFLLHCLQEITINAFNKNGSTVLLYQNFKNKERSQVWKLCCLCFSEKNCLPYNHYQKFSIRTFFISLVNLFSDSSFGFLQWILLRCTSHFCQRIRSWIIVKFFTPYFTSGICALGEILHLS